ncbi:hypothetical protein H6F44_03740 [Pseudanabaena sp. FACHB-1277]|jgi:hypothetical protein|uniref:Uncharacterized protein n=1 Tax=Pseudanabaena cinerea FACHB-1277 TaxID=2949581 RepID=A0A926Z504_9CYAN|nr:hypothetical protein [Pseudanabaena cinerea]MBD2149240.1 hypothetical protein [Pseudanabaena cinerea FACHB-1277]
MNKLSSKLLTALIGVVILTGLLLGNVLDVQAAQFSPIAIVAEGEVVETEAITEPEVTAEVAVPEDTIAPAAIIPAPEPPTVKPVTSPETASLLKQLETEILPQIESVLTPEQQVEFASKVAAGTSFRKAFKAVTLTPAQKNKLSAVFKSIPKKDIFATLTPAQKKELFMKNKQLFIPTSEEIGAKINAGMQMGKDKSKSAFAPSTEQIVDKISAKRKAIGIED